MNLKNLSLGAAICGLMLALLTRPASAATDWSTQDYDLYAADFNGDGRADILYIAKDASKPSGIAVADSSGAANIPFQSWPSNYLGLTWYGNAYTVIVGDFNGDGRADILLQASTPGDSFLLFANAEGKITGVSQQIGVNSAGVTGWSADQHRIVAGDFNADGKTDLFFQPTRTTGQSVVVLADGNGQFTTGPAQNPWGDGYLGFNWSTTHAIVYAGNFDGVQVNGHPLYDLLIQAKPSFVTVGFDVPFSVPTYPPNMNGVVYAHTGGGSGGIFQAGATTTRPTGTLAWSRMAYGADWSTQSTNIVVGSFNGAAGCAACSGVVLQAKTAGKTSYQLAGRSSGDPFSPATALASNVTWSADGYRLIAGNFAGIGHNTGIYLQTVSAGGANLYATDVNGTSVATTAHDPSNAMGSVPATAVGRTVGSFAVTNTGAASYSIPIAVPPGIAGMQPSLALTYQSGRGNGPLGVGWGISGLSQIERCKRTIIQDGTNNQVAYQATDSYCLDGKKLRLTSGAGTYGQANSTYQTEIDEFSRVTAIGSSGLGPDHFIVQLKNGLTYEYGNTSASRDDITGPSVWAVDKVTDRAGNYMNIAYAAGSPPYEHDFLPLYIKYTSNDSAGVGAASEVDFVWDIRPNNDVSSRAIFLSKLRNNYRLNRIEIYNSSFVKRYQLQYNTSGSNLRSRLSTVQECDGAGHCLPPTKISWQDGEAGLGTDTTVANLGPLGPYAVTADIDGDGRTDVVYPSGNYWAYMLANASGGYGPQHVTTTPHNGHYANAIAIDYNADGKAELLVPDASNHWTVLQFTGSDFNVTTPAPGGTPITANGGATWVGDIDGDGYQDLVYLSSDSTQLLGRFNSATGFSAEVTLFSVAAGGSIYIYNTTQSFNSQVILNQGDFNGDGRTDLLVKVNGAPKILLSTGSSYVDSGVVFSDSTDGFSIVTSTWVPLDTNGDGASDLVFMDSSGVWKVLYGVPSAGSGNLAGAIASNITTSGYSGATAVLPFDWDGDGRPDVLAALTPEGSVPGSNWFLLSATGDPLPAGTPGSLGPLTGATDTHVLTSQPATRVVDVNGDGLPDLVYADSSGGWHVLLHRGRAPDLVTSISDGFGNTVGLTYGPLTDPSIFTPGSGSMYPKVDLRGPLYVVSNYTVSDGVGSSYSVSETYKGARLDLKGRGFEGFVQRVETDSRTGKETTLEYLQDFPFAGMVWRTTVKQSHTGPTIAQTTNTITQTVLDGTSFNQRVFPFLFKSIQNNYEVGGVNDGVQNTQITSTYGYDPYGNLNDTDVVTLDTTVGQPTSGQQFESHQVLAFLNDAPTWCVSLLTRDDEYRYLPDGSAAHRVTSFTPDTVTSNCRTAHKIVEPSIPAWTVTTDYTFDKFGNIHTETVSATGITSRLTTYDYGTQGVFPTTVTNAAGEVAGKTYDYGLGVVLTATDANNLTTTRHYDGFGRKMLESRPDNTSTRWTLYACTSANSYCGDSQLRYEALEEQLDTSNAVVRYGVQMFDSLSRAKYEQSQTLSGAPAAVRTDYDNLGRILRRSQAYFPGATAYFAYFSYDLLDRPLNEKRPLNEADVAGTAPYCTTCRTTQYQYAYPRTTIIDANTKATVKFTNAIGQPVQVTDANTNNSYYTYDPFGNLLTAKDPSGNQTANTFNIRGFRMTSSDPDMGNWSYDYYPTGELKTQLDPLGHTVTMTYDGVSRMLTRVEPEGTTSWTWGGLSDNTATNKYVGLVKAVTAPGSYAESYIYDSLGRLQDATMTTGSTSLTVSRTYSSTLGLLETVTYPTSTTAVANSRFKVQYDYSYGLLQDVKDFNNPATLYWQQIATDAAGRTIDEAYGNNLHTYSTYDMATGRLGSRFTGASSQIQNLAYKWDPVGNLIERKDATVTPTLVEDFVPDNLNRLDHSTLNNSPGLTMIYDAAGNITSKSGVAYDYTHTQTGCTYQSNTQPHAVRKVGTAVYCYDANGNMVQRQGSTISWTSYNQPAVINQGANQAQFSYGAGRSRYKEVTIVAAGGVLPAGTETTLYFGGMFEKVTKPSGVIEYKHYIMAGKEAVALRTLRSNSVNDVVYLHKDHLGSVDTITNASAAIAVKLSFDAFGARRSPSDWQNPPSAGQWTSIAATTHRGFTYHEGIDAVGLVHMNGRVYDPSIGRFLSADPTVQSPFAAQDLNRYAYVLNNPLSLTDPSGFGFFGELWDTIAGFVRTFGPLIASIYTGNLAFGAVGGGFWGAVAAGAASGFTYGALSTAFNGGSVGQSLIAGFRGALVGGIIGGATYGIVDAVQFVANQAQYDYASMRGGLLFASNEPMSAPMETVVVSAWNPDSFMGKLSFALRSYKNFFVSQASVIGAGVIRGYNAAAAAVGGGGGGPPSQVRLSQEGESYIRYETANQKYSRITPEGGVQPGTYAAPSEEGLVPVEEVNSRYNLPDPELPRTNAFRITPPEGTPIIGPRPVMGGPGVEVQFPAGVPAGSAVPIGEYAVPEVIVPEVFIP